jgi:hypothetical protein
MDKETILQCFQELDQELARLGVIGEVCLYDGAVMGLVYQARPSTKDVDAIFQPTQQMRAAIARMAANHNLRAPATRSYCQSQAGALFEHAGYINVQLYSQFTFEPVRSEDTVFVVVGQKSVDSR